MTDLDPRGLRSSSSQQPNRTSQLPSKVLARSTKHEEVLVPRSVLSLLLLTVPSSSPHPSPTWRPPKPAEGITILIRTTHASMQTLIIQLGQSGGQLALAGLTMRVRFADGDGLRHASDWPQHRCALLRSMPGEGLASSILLWNLFQWPACLPAPISHRVARSELLFKTCNAPPPSPSSLAHY